jgi:hypothetical protein
MHSRYTSTAMLYIAQGEHVHFFMTGNKSFKAILSLGFTMREKSGRHSRQTILDRGTASQFYAELYISIGSQSA